MKKIILTILAVVLLSINLVSAKEVIDMKKESGVYTIPCEVNGLKLRFIFDTGASVVSISLTEVSFMLKNGYLDADDIIGTTDVAVANGSVDENYIINIKSLKIGSVTLKDVRAVVSNGLDAPLLLGQTVLDKLGHWSFRNSQLILNDYDGDDSEYSWEQLEEMLNSDNRNFALNYIRPLVRAGDDYAAYVFISNIANSTRIDRSLLQDQDVIKAMNVLSDLTNKAEDDVYCDYKKLIWFCLYRLGQSAKAIQYLKQCEASALLSHDDYDEFAFDIMIACGWDDPGRIDETFAEECLRSKYYRAYTTYANYLKDKKGQSQKAVQAYKRLSDAGYLPATTKLAVCYIEGIGVVKNVSQGLALLNKAAEGGNVQAIDELCERYYFGYGVKKDYDKVLKYANLFGYEGACAYLNDGFTGIAYYQKKYYKSALQNLNNLHFLDEMERGSDEQHLFITAMNSGLNLISDEILMILGDCYEHGLGTKVDVDLAASYYLKLTDSDPATGYALLGDMLSVNQLVEPDMEKAYHFYLLGANNDSDYCAYRLAWMNHYGIGTVKNAYKAANYKQQAIAGGVFKESDFDF